MTSSIPPSAGFPPDDAVTPGSQPPPSYQPQPGYVPPTGSPVPPSYAPPPGYAAQPGYPEQPGYAAQPSYPQQPYPVQQQPAAAPTSYPQQPGYAAQPSYPAPSSRPAQPAAAPTRRPTGASRTTRTHRAGRMAWVALVLGLAASAILGLSAWQGLGAIEFDLSPFTTAKWWGVGLAVAAALPIVAIVLSIVSLVRKANRAVAAVGLILSLFGPAGGLVAGANAGFDSLAHHAADVAREKGATALETIEIDGLPDWLSDLAVAAIRPSD